MLNTIQNTPDDWEMDNTDKHPTSKTVLNIFNQSWERRSRVRNHKLCHEDDFEHTKPDFLEPLLPFYNNPNYQNLKHTQKQSILSFGWLIYNLKTIAIESKIISPVCYDIIDGVIPGAESQTIKSVVSETLVDESYHILLCQNVIAITEQKRNINRGGLPRFDIVSKVDELKKKYPLPWQKILIGLATAVVSEIFISDYLKQISEAQNIVTINRETVKAHRMDELAHSKVFTELAKYIYSALNKQQKEFFEAILPYPVQYFSSKELSAWNSVLGDICPNISKKIINETIIEEWYDIRNLDYSDLTLLTKEMNIYSFEERLFDLQNQSKLYKIRDE